jgi:hypothetical protein
MINFDDSKPILKPLADDNSAVDISHARFKPTFHLYATYPTAALLDLIIYHSSLSD